MVSPAYSEDAPTTRPARAQTGPPSPEASALLHILRNFSVCSVKTFQNFIQWGYSQVRKSSLLYYGWLSPQGSTFCAAPLSWSYARRSTAVKQGRRWRSSLTCKRQLMHQELPVESAQAWLCQITSKSKAQMVQHTRNWMWRVVWSWSRLQKLRPGVWWRGWQQGREMLLLLPRTWIHLRCCLWLQTHRNHQTESLHLKKATHILNLTVSALK